MPEVRSFHVAFERADQPDVVALIEALDAYQKPLYPPESHHGVEIAALVRPNVIFAVARNGGGQALGCGALVIDDDLGDVKRMYVAPAHRDCGIATALLARLEHQGARQGCRTFALETGALQDEALNFYERCGYERCEPFGSYDADPHSIFMRKRAVAASG